MYIPTKKSEIKEVIQHLMIGGQFENMNFNFMIRYNGLMMRYDLNEGTYKFYTDIEKFAKAIVKFQKRGY